MNPKIARRTLRKYHREIIATQVHAERTVLKPALQNRIREAIRVLVRSD